MRDAREAPALEAADGVVVRPARPRDAASFLRLFRAVAAEGGFIRTERVTRTARDFRRRFRRSWTDERADLVAVAGNEVIGHLSIAREEHPVTRHVATFGMSVASAWRGRGVGSALLEEALRWADEVGVEKVELSVYPRNEAAIALYRKFGYTEEGRLVRHSKKVGGYLDEILMSLFIGPEAEAE
jgi:putative acetyltransferase